jgi:H+/Cl- antiporter ClcA
VAAAFNTPLAGVAFAIEELAAAYEQRTTLLVMATVLIAGMVSLGRPATTSTSARCARR